jgi:iron complex outermembrane recepter protein
MVMDLRDDLVFRGGVFRGMSRVDPSDMGYNRSFALNSSEDITDPGDLISSVSGSGNPFSEPLMSWNIDTALEWYPNADSILAVGVYYKQFTGGFEQIRSLETFTVDGQPITAPVTVSQTNDDTSDLYGVELTASHRWNNGLGFKLSYNWAHSNFEFQDSNYGEVTVRELDGSVVPLTVAIIEPGNVPGFSENVFSGQLYYQVGNFDTQLIYKYRSEYFQPYTSNGTRLRFIGDVGVWEARASYQLTDNFKLTLSAINILNEPKTQYFYTRDNLGEVNSYVRGKF